VRSHREQEAVNGVRSARVWAQLLGVERAVIEGAELEEAVRRDEVTEVLVCHVRPVKAERYRCGICRRRCPRAGQGEGRRRWRALDLGTVQAYLEADAPRVSCPEHGTRVAAVPWARHGARHTRALDDMVAWLAVTCSKSAVCELMRIAWRTVGAIIKRVCADVDARRDRLSGLARIGIDEISYRRGWKFLTVVIDHDAGRLVWAAPGRDRATVREFFDALGPERCQLITHVTSDAATWITDVITEKCPGAVQCADPFHIVKWATEALDEVRRDAWNTARRAGQTRSRGHGRRDATGNARKLKNARYALWKNPENLTANQQARLEWIALTDPGLYRAYLLKEGIRHVFKVKGDEGKQALDKWLSWASRSRLGPFVHLGRRLRAHRTQIDAALDHRLSNAPAESLNTKIRLITRIAYGFHDPHALIALAYLSLSGYRPPLPGR
jgi:transposase